MRGLIQFFTIAANSEVRVSATNLDIHFNEDIVITFNLLEAMRRKGVKELVFASSSSVYREVKVQTSNKLERGSKNNGKNAH